MSLVDNIADFATDAAIPVTRVAAETYDSHGRKVAGSTSSLSIQAVQVPVTGRDLQIKVDCQITTEIRALLTVTALKSREVGFAPDLLSIDGASWTVFHWEKWPTTEGDTFYRVLIARRALQ